MSLVALISDVHSNLHALEAVLDDVSSTVDRIICAGDIVGYNAHPGPAIDTLRDHEVHSVIGNHDRTLEWPALYKGHVQAYPALLQAREHLTDEQYRWVVTLPDTLRLCNGSIVITHSHPVETDRYVYPEDFPTLLNHRGEELVLVLGHTHVQHAEHYPAEDYLVINPGSVGQPRDGDPRAAYALLDTETFDVDLRRVRYDILAAQADIIASGLPESTAGRLARGC